MWVAVAGDGGEAAASTLALSTTRGGQGPVPEQRRPQRTGHRVRQRRHTHAVCVIPVRNPSDYLAHRLAEGRG